MRSLERVNIRTYVRTYSHTYVRDRPYIPSTTLLCEGIIISVIKLSCDLPSLFVGLKTQQALIQSGVTLELKVYRISNDAGSIIRISG